MIVTEIGHFPLFNIPIAARTKWVGDNVLGEYYKTK